MQDSHLFPASSIILDRYNNKGWINYATAKEFHRIIVCCQARNVVTYHKLATLFAINGTEWDTKNPTMVWCDSMTYGPLNTLGNVKRPAGKISQSIVRLIIDLAGSSIHKMPQNPQVTFFDMTRAMLKEEIDVDPMCAFIIDCPKAFDEIVCLQLHQFMLTEFEAEYTQHKALIYEIYRFDVTNCFAEEFHNIAIKKLPHAGRADLEL